MTRGQRLSVALLVLLLAAVAAVALTVYPGWRAAKRRAEASPALLEVSVLAPDGRPGAAAKVTLERGEQVQQRVADARGLARFERQPAGDVRVEVSRSGAARQAQTVTLGPGKTPLRVELVAAGKLFGVVVDDTDAPVAGATVMVQSEHERVFPPGFEATSDAEGRFSFDELAAGRHGLRVNAERHELAVVPALEVPVEEPVRVVLERTSRLHGAVLDGAGAPAAGAMVTIAGSGVWPPRELQADDQGRFALDPVPNGIYELRARRGSWVAKPLEGVLVEPASDAEVNLRLEPGAALRGRVYDAERGTPLPKLKVTLLEDALSGAPLATETADDGAFSFEGLRTTPHRVWIEAPGYVAIAGQSRTPGPEPHAFALRRAAVLSGTVVDELGKIMAGAEIEVTGIASTGEPVRVVPPEPADAPRATGLQLITPPAPGDSLGIVPGRVPKVPLYAPPIDGAYGSGAFAAPVGFVTDAAGSFRIEGVPAGRIELVARQPGYAPTRTAPRKVAPGAAIDDLRIVLARGATLLGRLLDAGGQAVPTVLVQLEIEGEPSARATLSGDDGRFRFDALKGRCIVTALPQGTPPVREQLELGPGEQREVTLVLSGESRELAGRVLDARGFPVASASVRVQALDARFPVSRSAVSTGDGTFRVAGLPAPPYTVEVDHPDYAATRLTPVSPDPHAELKVELHEGARVRGLVLDRMKNAGITAARVRLRQGKALRTTRSDARGAFEFRNVNAGNYEVLVDAEGYVPSRAQTALDAASDRELDPITLGPAGGLSGDVVDRLGAPVFDAEVAVGMPAEWARAVRTDHRGHFALKGIPPGEHWVSARHASAGTSPQPALVRVYALQESPGLVLRLSAQAP